MRLQKAIQLLNFLFWPMHRICESSKIPKTAICFDFARYSDFQFSATASSIFSVEILFQNLVL